MRISREYRRKLEGRYSSFLYAIIGQKFDTYLGWFTWMEVTVQLVLAAIEVIPVTLTELQLHSEEEHGKMLAILLL
ncbi:hypothetical protein RDI58_014983 [Solanum bulbocastanum]|uniref:Uncharacterized protein n=1 Tax=Solanum bulbocastanum TaxID=147425 RepID=A0AAN8TKP9_SOLBU